MLDIGIMVEGQEHMTWERFLGLAKTVEELGFDSLFRSDHLTALGGEKERESLALWPSLTAIALETKRIRFGPMVCSMTFRHPAMLAKMAASVSDLSGGRLDLGLGAGWYQGKSRCSASTFPTMEPGSGCWTRAPRSFACCLAMNQPISRASFTN